MKIIRVTLRDGTTRFHNPQGATLPQLWNAWRSEGGAIGEAWCAQFDAISHAEVVEAPDIEKPAESSGVSKAIGLQQLEPFKFPGQA